MTWGERTPVASPGRGAHGGGAKGHIGRPGGALVDPVADPFHLRRHQGRVPIALAEGRHREVVVGGEEVAQQRTAVAVPGHHGGGAEIAGAEEAGAVGEAVVAAGAIPGVTADAGPFEDRLDVAAEVDWLAREGIPARGKGGGFRHPVLGR